MFSSDSKMSLTRCLIYLCVFYEVTVLCRPNEMPMVGSFHHNTELSECSLFLKERTWDEGMQVCQQSKRSLLCYKSPADMQEMMDRFPQYLPVESKKLWLSSRTCGPDQINERCLVLNPQKTQKGWLYTIQRSCSTKLQFICCQVNYGSSTVSPKEPISIRDSTHTTSAITEKTGTKSVTVRTSVSAISVSTTAPPVTHCLSIKRREVLWPDTRIGLIAWRPCPGNSIGNATWFCSASSRDWSPSEPDMSQCHSVVLRKIMEKFENMTAKEAAENLEGLYKNDKILQGNDLLNSVDLISQLPDKLLREIAKTSLTENARHQLAMEVTNKSTTVLDKMIGSSTWSDIPEKTVSKAGTEMLSSVDSFGLMLVQLMKNETTDHSIVKENIMLHVRREKYGNTLKFPKNNNRDLEKFGKTGSITLFNGYAAEFDSSKGPVSVVYAFYSDMRHILTARGNSGMLNSPVVSIAVGQGALKPTSIPAKVHIQVEHLDPEANSSTCVFWNLNRNTWDDKGCHLLDKNNTHSFCVCDHLTNFAVLTDFGGVIPNVDTEAFFLITVIGCSLSIISLAICVAVFTFYRYFRSNTYNMRYSIHRNLCITLFLANVFLLGGINKTENHVTCAVVAGFLHYFFLSAFSWMLLEGVHIYLLLVIVFASKRTHWEKYYLFGYGFPLIIVGITAICRPGSYGTTKRCWLSTEYGSVWSFTGPVACILLMNSAALILAQLKASKISLKTDRVSQVKRWLRITLILFPILGLTWIFGFLYIGAYPEIMAYAFAILNSLQGFCIFICHCVMDKKIRNLVSASIRKKRATKQTDSGGSKRTKRSSSASNAEGLTLKPDIKSETLREKWLKIRNPWSFCFTLELSHRSRSSGSETQENLAKAVVLQRHYTVEDKNSL